jgi:formate/nitrite transporter FocA (FNT family)
MNLRTQGTERGLMAEANTPAGLPQNHRQTEKKREQEDDQIAARSAIGAHVVYQAILVEGMEELQRPASALAFSGVAAGLSMGFSLVAQGLLHAYLPQENWRPLISKLGYSAGFLMVIMGRQQLFTENTLTAVLPLLHYKNWKVFWNVLRLWLVVLGANLAGATAFAYVAAQTPVFEQSVKDAFLEMGLAPLKFGFGTVLLRGIFAGWLIAFMVWMLPYADAVRFWVIIFITYLVGLGHLTHIIAGSVDVLYAVAAGQISWGEYLWRFMLPTLIGNTIGGVSLVAALNYAQVVSGREHS